MMEVFRKGIFREAFVFGTIVLFIGSSIVPLMGSTALEKNHMQENVISSLYTCNGVIIYVNNSNIKDKPDGSYENPFRDITSALEKAYEDDDPNIVFVFCGNRSYNESLILTKPVHLIGEHKIGKYTCNPIIQTTEVAAYGIRIETDRALVEGFRIRGNKKDCSGIRLYRHTWRNKISYNVIENCKYGVELEDKTVWNDISYNLIQNCSEGAIFTNAPYWSGGNTMVNNLIRNIETKSAIYLSKSSSNIINGNFIKNCHKGIEILASFNKSRFNIIASNVFDNCSDYDIYLDDAGYGNIIFGNDFLHKDDAMKAGFTNTVITFWRRNYWADSKYIHTIYGSILGITHKQYDLNPQMNRTVTDYKYFIWPPYSG